ncbi:uncharacterized protein LOC110452889 [Mizuhopecten yessoensis]|uniref:uncharacterized protein LOC110452889 n=1 Tax=Mizuhopecten yessoensis TaxID=6573 RepID=UPI000B45B066|nr:uncharacterized protein LOC110452889 [Mizuhopecten yessoensis]
MDNPPKRSLSVTSDPKLDREFFSPPDPRGEQSFLRAVPTVGLGLVLALGVVVYQVKMWPKMKAKGYDFNIYFWNARFVAFATFYSLTLTTIFAADLSTKANRKRNNITDEDVHRAMFGDHTPRKLPTLKIKPYEGNPMALFKTNILEQVLLKKINAKSQVD